MPGGAPREAKPQHGAEEPTPLSPPRTCRRHRDGDERTGTEPERSRRAFLGALLLGTGRAGGMLAAVPTAAHLKQHPCPETELLQPTRIFFPLADNAPLFFSDTVVVRGSPREIFVARENPLRRRFPRRPRRPSAPLPERSSRGLWCRYPCSRE